MVNRNSLEYSDISTPLSVMRVVLARTWCQSSDTAEHGGPQLASVTAGVSLATAALDRCGRGRVPVGAVAVTRRTRAQSVEAIMVK